MCLFFSLLLISFVQYKCWKRKRNTSIYFDGFVDFPNYYYLIKQFFSVAFCFLFDAMHFKMLEIILLSCVCVCVCYCVVAFDKEELNKCCPFYTIDCDLLDCYTVFTSFLFFRRWFEFFFLCTFLASREHHTFPNRHRTLLLIFNQHAGAKKEQKHAYGLGLIIQTMKPAHSALVYEQTKSDSQKLNGEQKKKRS